MSKLKSEKQQSIVNALAGRLNGIADSTPSEGSSNLQLVKEPENARSVSVTVSNIA